MYDNSASSRSPCLLSGYTQVMLIANNGVIMRQKVGKISDQSRQATGVRVQRLDQGTHIREVALVSAEAVEDEALVTSTTSEPAKEPGTPPGTSD